MVATTDLSHITENAYGITGYTEISYYDESAGYIYNATSSTITVGSDSVPALTILEPEGTFTDVSSYTGGIWIAGTGEGDYIDASEFASGIEYSFNEPRTEKNWEASVKFSDSSAHNYAMDRDGEGVLSFKTHLSSSLVDSIGFYGIEPTESVNATLDSNNTLTAIATNGIGVGTLTATNVTYLVDGRGNDTFTGNENANFFMINKGSDTVTAGGGEDFFVVRKDADLTITDYQAGEWISLEKMGFDSVNFTDQITVTYDSAANKTILGIDTASYTNDDTLTLNGRYTLSSVEMGNRRLFSENKSDLLLQFEGTEVLTSDLSHITENAWGIADYTWIKQVQTDGPFILNGTSSTIQVGGNSVSALSLLEPDKTLTDLSPYTGGIWINGTGDGDYIDASENSLGIEYSFSANSFHMGALRNGQLVEGLGDWEATLRFSDSSAHSYTMSRDGDGILSFQNHAPNNIFDSVGFYSHSETVNATLDSNNTLTAVTTWTFDPDDIDSDPRNFSTGTLTATNVTAVIDGRGNDTFVGNDNANYFLINKGSDTVTAGGGEDFFVIRKDAHLTITDYQDDEWISLEKMNFDSVNFANQITVTYDSVANKTILGIDTASFTNDDTLTLDGHYALSTSEMGNRRGQSDSKSELLVQFEEVSAGSQYSPIGSVLITGDELEGSVLTGDGSAVTDGDGIVSSSITYQWLRDGLEISGATSSEYTLTQADVGKSVAVKYSFRDQSTALEEVVSAGSALVANVNSAASGSVAITGKAFEGSTLTADISGVVDEDGIDVDLVGYQWILNGSDIVGATSVTYNISGLAIGDNLSVRSSYEDNYGQNESLTSSAKTVTNLIRYPNTDSNLADLPGQTINKFETDIARVLNPNGNLVEITLPTTTDITTFITSETPRDDETVYTAELPGTGGVSQFTWYQYAYEFMVDNNGQNIALVYSGERFQADRGYNAGAGIVRFYDFDGDAISNEIIYTNQTDQGHRPSVYSINPDQYLILFQTNNPLDMPRLAPDVGYVVGRVINADTFEMEDTFVVAADTNLLVDAPQISMSSDGQINISWNEYDLDNIFHGEHTTVYGGSLNEMISGTNSGDYLYGQDGDDEIEGLGGDDVIDGGEGVDIVEAGEGDDIVNGGDGDDLIIGGNGAGDDYYKGGDGIDTVKYTSATDSITVNLTTGTATSTNGGDAAGIGTDTLTGIENIIGGNFSDILTGSSGANIIQGVAGSDLIDGAAGDDTITLTGSSTYDGLSAHNVGSSSDVATNIKLDLTGKVKLETVVDGGADADTINLGSGNDAFFLHDSFSGFHSSLNLTTDTHTGAQSTQRIMNVETINGLAGDDIIDLTSPDYSLAGQVITINGGRGHDVIWGSDATETLIGGDGNDILFGGSGNDTLTGGSGADTFEFTRTAGSDTITDFQSGSDSIKIYSDYTFSVSKTDSSTANYSIDGQSDPILNLVRGKTYTFEMSGNGHPFYIKSTSSTSGTSDEYTDGITRIGSANSGSDGDKLQFTATSETPDTLWYQCSAHIGMLGKINIVDKLSETLEISGRENALVCNTLIVQIDTTFDLDDVSFVAIA